MSIYSDNCFSFFVSFLPFLFLYLFLSFSSFSFSFLFFVCFSLFHSFFVYLILSLFVSFLLCLFVSFFLSMEFSLLKGRPYTTLGRGQTMDQNTRQKHKGAPPWTVIRMLGPHPGDTQQNTRNIHSVSEYEIKIPYPAGNPTRPSGLEGRDSTDYTTQLSNKISVTVLLCEWF